MRFLTVAFALTILATVVLIVPVTSRDTLIAPESVSVSMPRMLR